MRWKKQGVIFCANHEFPWMQSHAANPVVELLEESQVRIYFSTRDATNRSSIAYVEIDLTSPQKILKISPQPILSPGLPGLFDDSGTSMACLVQQQDQSLLYYLGWNLGVTVPWRNSIGLAIQDRKNPEKQNFQKYSHVPLLDRNEIDPYSLSYPWVLKDGEIWRMWYGSNLNWGPKQTDMAHIIKYAESTDGLHWNPQGKIAISFKAEHEYAISKPCVLKDKDRYRMWYSYRGSAYQIGYAESKDGIHWERLDHLVGISVSKEGWDSLSICYPCVFDHCGSRYLLYNGNAYGATGFGLAILEQD